MAENVLHVNLDDLEAVLAAIPTLQERAKQLRIQRRREGLTVEQRLGMRFSLAELTELGREGGFSPDRVKKMWNRLSGNFNYQKSKKKRSGPLRRYKLGLDGGLVLGMLVSENFPRSIQYMLTRDLVKWLLHVYELEPGMPEARAWEVAFLKSNDLKLVAD